MTTNAPSPHAIRMPLILMAILMVAAAVSGGSNRADVMAVMLVRLAAVLCLGFAIVRLPHSRARDARVPLLLLAALAVWMALQIVPLPPALWTAMPGRERLAATARAAGIAQPWLPISLSLTRTLGSLLSLFVPAAALLLVAWLPRTTWTIQILALIAIGLASSLLALVQVSGPIDSVWYLYDVRQKGGAVGFFANRNHQAALLACMFPMLAILSMQAVRVGRRAMEVTLSCAAIAMFLLPLIFVTGSRGGLLLAGVSLVATAALVWPLLRRSAVPSRWLMAGGGAIVVVAAALLAVLLLSERSLAFQRLFATDVGEEQRVLVVQPILALIGQYMPFGTGFGTFDPAYRAIEPYSQLFRTYLNHAHSDPLEFVSDGGVPAAIILLVFLGWWAISCVSIWRQPRIGDAARMATIVTALLMLASLVDYPLRTPLAAMVFAIMVGWIAKAVHDGPVVDGNAVDTASFGRPKSSDRGGDRRRRKR